MHVVLLVMLSPELPSDFIERKRHKLAAINGFFSGLRHSKNDINQA